MMSKKDISLEQARSYLSQLNLQYIVNSMCAESYALPRWTREDALHCEQLYKDFLLLQKKHFPEHLVPTREIDEFWHNHILSTKNYMNDCQHIFGHYLHHEPAVPGDEKLLITQYLKTKEFYLEEFKHPLELHFKDKKHADRDKVTDR